MLALWENHRRIRIRNDNAGRQIINLNFHMSDEEAVQNTTVIIMQLL
jgi:hypothetical protein